MVCYYLLVQVFIIGHQASSLQQGIDNVFDSVAVHMATEGQDYSDAMEKTNEVAGTIRDYTGVNLGNVSLDADQLDQNIVSVSASSNVMQYHLSRSASTYFSSASSLRKQIVAYALSWVGITPYHNGTVGGTRYWGYEGLLRGTDCWGFTSSVFHEFFPF